MPNSKDRKVSEVQVKNGELLVEKVAVLVNVETVLGTAKEELEEGDQQRVGELIDLAESSLHHACNDIVSHAKKMTNVPISRISANQQRLATYEKTMGVWKRRSSKQETAERKLKEYVKSVSQEDLKRTEAPSKVTPPESKSWHEKSPAKKKIDMKDTPEKMKSGGADLMADTDPVNALSFDNDGPSRALNFEMSVPKLIDPWPIVVFSNPDIEAVLASMRILRWSGPPTMPYDNPLFTDYKPPPAPKNRSENAYSPIEAATYLCAIDGNQRGSEDRLRRRALEDYWMATGLLPCGVWALRRARKQYENKNRLKDWWDMPGRHALLPIHVLRSVAGNHVTEKPGLVLGPDAVVAALSAHKVAEAIAKGVVARH
jgi:hypothetical protein